MYMCGYVYMCGYLQRPELDSLELEFQTLVGSPMWVQGTKLEHSVGEIPAFNH